MNAARRARKKAQPGRKRHDHRNRAARTSPEGKIARCPYCWPAPGKWERV